MKNAKELMLEFTAFSIRDPKKAAEMFAEDGAFEMTLAELHARSLTAHRVVGVERL